MRYPAYLEQNFTFPDFFRVQMRYPRFQIDNIENAVSQALDEVLPASGIRAGHRVAIGVGSRGIANLPLMIRTLCRRFIKMGAFPIIIPAMGSHGSATDKGQKDVLKTLEIGRAHV